MPRIPFIKTKIPMEQPDCCAECPLLGLIPHEERPKGTKETHVCIARQEALSGRGTRVRKSNRDSNHPLRRPCDKYWDAWYQNLGGSYPVKQEFYIRYRHPYELSQQMIIRFHR